MARLEPLSQQMLALELRWQIDRLIYGVEDVGRARTTAVSLARIRKLVAEHPHAMTTNRLRVRLGTKRWEWLQRKGVIE